jgi:polar amino acid transport system substrate-binding protein
VLHTTMSPRKFVAFFSLLCSAWAGAAHAGPLCLDRPISFAHYEFGLLYSEGYGGIDDDVQKELAKRSGCAFETSLRPRARIWVELERGTLDMAGSGVQTPARDKFAWFAHYVVEDNHVHIGPNVPASVKSMEDFIADPKLILGGVRSYSYSPNYDRQIQTLMDAKRFYSVNDPIMLYRMFDMGRYDIFIASQFLSLHYFKILQLKPPKRVQDWDQDRPTPSGLVVSKKTFTPEQAEGWQRLIAQMLADGTMRKILVKHLGEEQGPPAMYVRP